VKETLKVLFSAKAKKALTAGGVAFLGGVGAACAYGVLTGNEVVVSFGAGLVTLAAVFKVSNAPSA